MTVVPLPHPWGVSAARAVLLAAALLCLLLPGALRAQTLGTLTMLFGRAEVTRGAETLTVREGARLPLQEADRIETGSGAKGHVVFAESGSGAAEAVITEETTVVVNTLRGARARSPVSLVYGAIRSRVRRWLFDTPFLGSPVATIGIKGTDFITYVKREEATEMIGVEGRIEAVSRVNDAHRLEIGRRQWGEIVAGEAPRPPIRVPDPLWRSALAEFRFPDELPGAME